MDLTPSDIYLAKQAQLTANEFAVVHAKLKGYGRRRGSVALGITEEQWRYRMNSALRKLAVVKQEAA